MEWMLQVVDDLDDVVNAVLHTSVGRNADLGLLAAAGAGVAAIVAGLAMGEAGMVLDLALGLLSLGGALKWLSLRQAAGPETRSL